MLLTAIHTSYQLRGKRAHQHVDYCSSAVQHVASHYARVLNTTRYSTVYSKAITGIKFFGLCKSCAFSIPTLLTGHQKGHLAFQKTLQEQSLKVFHRGTDKTDSNRRK